MPARHSGSDCSKSSTSIPWSASPPASSTQAASRPTCCSSTNSPAASDPWTEKLWVYDLRTNQHFTQKQNPLRRSHLDEFVDCYKPGRPRSERVESERFEAFTYDELIARDEANLDLIWLKDDSIEDAADLPAPDVLAVEIMEELEAALGEFAAIVEGLDPTVS